MYRNSPDSEHNSFEISTNNTSEKYSENAFRKFTISQCRTNECSVGVPMHTVRCLARCESLLSNTIHITHSHARKMNRQNRKWKTNLMINNNRIGTYCDVGVNVVDFSIFANESAGEFIDAGM